ncbi:MAG TPA: tautomerase family protein [Nitrososphaeraceae archaeon]|nr:tautomerase family protein [Nitrososphaeraceae archaeon]
MEQKSISFLYVSGIMPIITLSLFCGRSQREKDRLAEAITESTCKILNVDKKEVIIVFREEPHGNWYSAGVRI